MTEKTPDFIEAQINPSGPKVHIELPVLDGHDALRFVGLLSHIIDAVWTTHYMEMSEILREGDPTRRRFLPKGLSEEGINDFPLLQIDDEDLPF